MKIDLFCHLFPKNFYDRMLTVSGKSAHMQKRVRGIPCIVDLDVRFRMMDRFPDYVQVISLAAPQIEALGEPPVAAELASLANDGTAELVVKHPDRFPGFIASLAMNNVEASLAEVDRYISWPGQALSYYLGEASILKMRAKAEKALGAKFNIRAFHDAVLGQVDHLTADQKSREDEKKINPGPPACANRLDDVGNVSGALNGVEQQHTQYGETS